jgi:hypothetical protein
VEASSAAAINPPTRKQHTRFAGSSTAKPIAGNRTAPLAAALERTVSPDFITAGLAAFSKFELDEHGSGRRRRSQRRCFPVGVALL